MVYRTVVQHCTVLYIKLQLQGLPIPRTTGAVKAGEIQDESNCAVPGVVHVGISGTVPGTVLFTLLSTVHCNEPDTVPSRVSDTVPGTVPGNVHDTVHSAVLSSVPNTVTGTVHSRVPGSVLR